MFTRPVGHNALVSDIVKSVHAPAAATAAVITLTAVADRRRVIHNIQWSYSETPTGGLLTITDGGTTVWQIGIPSGGPGGFQLVIPGGINSEMVITLASGGGTCVGKVNVQSILV